MDTIARWGNSARSYRRAIPWVIGVLLIIGLTGCSGVAVEAQSNYRSVVAQVTATASGSIYQSQGAVTAVPNNLAIQATQIRQQFDFAGKQSENQAFTTIGLGWLILLTIAGLTTLGVFLYAKRLKYKIDLEEKFVFAARQQPNRLS